MTPIHRHYNRRMYQPIMLRAVLHPSIGRVKRKRPKGAGRVSQLPPHIPIRTRRYYAIARAGRIVFRSMKPPHILATVCGAGERVYLVEGRKCYPWFPPGDPFRPELAPDDWRRP